MSIYFKTWTDPSWGNALAYPNLEVIDHDQTRNEIAPGVTFRFWSAPLVNNRVRDVNALYYAAFSVQPMPACCGMCILSGWQWKKEATKEQNKVVFDVLKRLGKIWSWTRGFLILNPHQTAIVELLGNIGLPPYHHDGFKNLNSNNKLEMYTIALR